jgi:hypothetical protein
MVEVAYNFIRAYAVFRKGRPSSLDRGSYGWSRFFHNWTDHPVSNGEFLAAVERFPEAKLWPNGLNARLNINFRQTMHRAGFLKGRGLRAIFGPPDLPQIGSD